ncbi:ATP binding domain 4 [Podila humilis]|nr:ATP binding domain 4 [Podila humilis]
MKVLGLISGGKDSFYNLMQCVANGHSVIALGNLHPHPQDKKDELDSYMYQTVGHDVIHLYEECMQVPLYRQTIKGTPIEQGSDYVETNMDETEDLYELLRTVKEIHPDLQAVSVGAILSNYQRIRVENVCARLGLVALAYLWQRDQEELLYEMAQVGVNAVLIKIAALGLKRQHLGQSIGDMFPHLCKMNQQFDLHICGEGGEYETITLDCPLFKKRIVVDESEIVIHSDDAFAQVAYLRFKQLHLEDKSEDDLDSSWTADMNLDPVWTADSMTLPIRDIVSCKQTSTHSPEKEEACTARYRTNSGDNADELYHSRHMAHSSPLVCAIGGTTAYDDLATHGKKHMSISEETTACLENVQERLKRIGLSWKEVVFMQVFVTNMSDFGVVNGAYKAFFGINPPPRACVGAYLPGPCRVQVNCTAIRNNVKGFKPRKTLHVQGMSYWAPANIGPYSQATEYAHHSFIAGQIGMIPSTLDLPMPPSLAMETSWSLRNLLQIASNRQCDLVNRTSFCIVYVNDPDHFEPVLAAWTHINSKDKPAPLLAICMPSLPKGAQVEWQALLHYDKVYAEKAQQPSDAKEDVEKDGYDTDDDDMYKLEKRALYPTTLTLNHEPSEQPLSLPWKSTTQSWFLAPILSVLSVASVSKESLSSMMLPLSSLSLQTKDDTLKENATLPMSVLKDMMAMMIQAVDRVLESHKSPVQGPGVSGGWNDVVGVTFYYKEGTVRNKKNGVKQLCEAFDKLLEAFVGSSAADGLTARTTTTTKQRSESKEEEEETKGGVAVTFVPVRAIANNGLLALTAHAVGTTPTVPGLLQQYHI